MEDDLRRIAIENVKNRNKSGCISVMTGLFTIVLFVISIETDFKEPVWWILSILIFTVGISIGFHYQNKVIGKKTAIDMEVERLKALYPEDKLELPKIDDAELKLKEMIRRSNRDDML